MSAVLGMACLSMLLGLHSAESWAQHSEDAKTWTLESFLLEASKTNALIKAARLQKEASQLRQNMGDLAELSPLLQAEYVYTDDQRETAFPAQQGTRTKTRRYSLGVSKKFVTGTTLFANVGQGRGELEGLAFPFEPNWETQYTLGARQSLWKDFFGSGIRVRRAREDATSRAERLGSELAERQALMTAEETYWELAYQSIDRIEKEAALARVRKLRDWTARRLNNGIGDRSDLLQVEGLLARRQLEQMSTSDAYTSAFLRFQDFIGRPLNEGALVPADAFGAESRFPEETAKLIRLDAWVQRSASEAAAFAADETVDRFRPDLVVEGSVGANGREAGFSDSSSEGFSRDNPIYNVGLKLQVNLDFGLQSRIARAARSEAAAARIKAERAATDPASSWEELSRKHREVVARVKAAEQLVGIQERKLAREQERLSVGRSTTFQVLTFEQDIADARTGLLQLRYQQRRLESASGMYMSQEAAEAL
jgi:outer membrane protein TolC